MNNSDKKTILHLINTDENILNSLQKSNGLLESDKNISKKINENIWIARSLLELIPITPENIMSGHMFPLGEAEDEFESSIQLCKLGFYKHANMALRNFLELGLLSVYYDIEDNSHIIIQNWLGSHENTPYKKTVFKKLLENVNIEIFDKKHKIFEKTNNYYELLSNFTHTKGYRYSFKRLNDSNINSFKEKSFRKWMDSMTEVLSIVTAFHILKYPIALQYTPIDEKFGLNPPAGGFWRPNQAENVRNLFIRDWIDTLQEISNNDTDAIAIAKGFNELPDLTESEISKQIENEHKHWIKMQGYKKWENNQRKYLNVLKNRSATEYLEELNFLNKAKEWAKENNYDN